MFYYPLAGLAIFGVALQFVFAFSLMCVTAPITFLIHKISQVIAHYKNRQAADIPIEIPNYREKTSDKSTLGKYLTTHNKVYSLYMPDVKVTSIEAGNNVKSEEPEVVLRFLKNKPRDSTHPKLWSDYEYKTLFFAMFASRKDPRLNVLAELNPDVGIALRDARII